MQNWVGERVDTSSTILRMVPRTRLRVVLLEKASEQARSRNLYLNVSFALLFLKKSHENP